MAVAVSISLVGFDNAVRRLRLMDRPTEIARGAKFFARQRMQDTGVKLAQVQAPVGVTGDLKNSIRLETFESPDTLESVIIVDVPYARHVTRGTGVYGLRQHPIIPTHAKSLVFFWHKKNIWMRVKSVKGQPPNPWLKNVSTVLRQRLMTTLPQEIRRSVEIIVSGGE